MFRAFRPVLSAALLASLLPATSRADLVYFTDLAGFDAQTNTALVEDFEARGAFPRDTYVASFSHNGITFTGHAGVPIPNVFVSSPGYNNYGLPGPTTTSILTANGNESFTLAFAAPAAAVGFDTYLNAFGPATLGIYGASGLLGTYVHAQNPALPGFFGVVSDQDLITSIRWTTVHGGLINTGIDNIRLGAPDLAPPPVPEPGTWALFGLGALLAAARCLRKSRKA